MLRNVSSSPSWFILGAMSAFGDVAFIWFHFKNGNEMKKIQLKKIKK